MSSSLDSLDPTAARQAFLLVCLAGLATGLGAAVVFSNNFSFIYNSSFLAGSLSFSGGVMLYVSFIEIFNKSLGSFIDSGLAEETAYLYATLCFFGGVAFMQLLDYVVHSLSGNTKYEVDSKGEKENLSVLEDVASGNDDNINTVTKLSTSVELTATKSSLSQSQHIILDGTSSNSMNLQEGVDIEEDIENSNNKNKNVGSKGQTSEPNISNSSAFLNDMDKTEKQNLVKVGLVTALAIGLHNFPEGLATFVGALADIKIGLGLAVAIGIHNIPEGLCVAIPIYYATKHRWYAFTVALFSGVSELIGAGLGWIVLYNRMSDTLYATIFGFVGGMMVSIVLNEILPTAYRYDPNGKITKICLNAGMIVMALSLVLFAVL